MWLAMQTKDHSVNEEMDLVEMDLVETGPAVIDPTEVETITRYTNATSYPMNPAIRNDIHVPPPSARR
jgi:hypothetical protein